MKAASDAGYDLVLRSRRVVTPSATRPAAVCIKRGRIAAIEEYATPGQDLGDLALLPGLIDPHVHVNEPGRTDWEGFATATRAAAAGGVTTIIDMPLNCLPPTVSVAALAAKRRAARGQPARGHCFACDLARPGGFFGDRLRRLHRADGQ